MPAPAWEDLDEFLALDEFATTATFTTMGNQVRQVVGIFDEAYFNADIGEYDIATAEPRFTCKQAQVAGLKKHDGCSIGGVQYTLDHDPHPDGTGMAVVMLVRVFE